MFKPKISSNKLKPSYQKADSEVAKEDARNKTDQIKRILDLFLFFSKNRVRASNKEPIIPETME